MIYRTVSLYDLMNQKIGKDKIAKILTDFSCPINEDVEYFVHHKAYDFERVGLARTFLIYASLDDKNFKLAAIYSLGLSNVEISDSVTNTMKKKLFGTSYPMEKNVKTLLIGQLSKNYNHGNNQLITGDTLMVLIFERIKIIHTLFPSVVTHVDCKDIPQLRNYYERYGFKFFKKKDDRLIYLLPTNKIIAYLETKTIDA